MSGLAVLIKCKWRRKGEDGIINGSHFGHFIFRGILVMTTIKCIPAGVLNSWWSLGGIIMLVCQEFRTLMSVNVLCFLFPAQGKWSTKVLQMDANKYITSALVQKIHPSIHVLWFIDFVVKRWNRVVVA